MEEILFTGKLKVGADHLPQTALLPKAYIYEDKIEEALKYLCNLTQKGEYP